MGNRIIQVLLLVALFAFSSASFAQNTGNDSLIGIISVTRDATGAITGATLEAETYDDNDNVVSNIYTIVLNDVSKPLVEANEGLEVNVTGTISESKEPGKSGTITITSCEKLTEEVLPEPVDDAPAADDGNTEGDVDTSDVSVDGI